MQQQQQLTTNYWLLQSPNANGLTKEEWERERERMKERNKVAQLCALRNCALSNWSQLRAIIIKQQAGTVRFAGRPLLDGVLLTHWESLRFTDEICLAQRERERERERESLPIRHCHPNELVLLLLLLLLSGIHLYPSIHRMLAKSSGAVSSWPKARELVFIVSTLWYLRSVVSRVSVSVSLSAPPGN